MPTDDGFRTTVFEIDTEVAARPAAVFPLLCPIRELEWVEGWSCRLLHSESGFAEPGCVFTTDHDGPAVWLVSRHEPPTRVEFVIVMPDVVAVHLGITLEARGPAGTNLHWRRAFTPLTAEGEAYVARLTPKLAERHRVLARSLDYFLAHDGAPPPE